jgi:DNA-directed RNA polymerase subunit omega
MIHPSLDILVKKVDSKYTLVVFAAKRARELMSGDAPLVECKSNKPVTVALEEIAQGKIVYERTKAGIK